MNKTVAFKKIMPKQNVGPADDWVAKRTPDIAEGQGVPAAVPAEPMKRFTIDVTERLHKRIKAQCAMKGDKMADVIREMLEEAFPEQAA